MSEQLLNVLKLCLLVVLYLFFLRVLRAVWMETRAPVVVAPDPGAHRESRAARPVTVGGGTGGARAVMLVVEPAEQRGREYRVDGELTIGRAPGCGVRVDDQFVSQLHARIVATDGSVVVEDLGSTNGTFVNRAKVTAPVGLSPGDHVQVGSTVLELR